MIAHQRKGLLFVLVGPTGAGKNTIMNRVLEKLSDLTQLPTATTRAIRPTEQEGREHHFLTMEEFQVMIKNNDLLEHENVHGRWYGVPRQTVANAVDAFEDRIADIDVYGAMKVRAAFPDNTILIFVQPGTSDDVASTIRERLENRGEDSVEIENRLRRVPLEMSYAPLCDYLIENDDIEHAADTLHAIIIAERSHRKLLNLRVRKGHPRHRIVNMSSALITNKNQVLVEKGSIPQIEIRPGEYPDESIFHHLPNTLTFQGEHLVDITTQTSDYFDQLTFWYQARLESITELPEGWSWENVNEVKIPPVVRNKIESLTYSC
jgi:guanylate kinase